jgi:hypothetical protein
MLDCYQDMTAALRDGCPASIVERLAQRDAAERASLEAGVRGPLSPEDLALPGACNKPFPDLYHLGK